MTTLTQRTTTPAADTVTMTMAGSSPLSSKTDWIILCLAPGGGDPEREQHSELTQDVFSCSSFEVTVEETQIAHEKHGSDGGDDDKETSGRRRR